MEDLFSDLMDESEDFDEFDAFLESFDAPRYFDFTAVDNTRPDSPSWFCARIGCNQNHEQVEAEALDRSFKHRVSVARAPILKRQKPPKPDRARPTPKYVHSAPAKPAASVRVGSAASTRGQKQFALNKADCHMLTSNKGKKPDSTNSKDLVLSEMPNSIGSICSVSKTSSIVSEIPVSSQTTHTDSFENAMDADKENVPSTTCLEENCDKSNLLQKSICMQDCGNQHGEREKSKRMTIPKPFKLLTNERRIQREANLEKNINSEAKRENVSALRGRDGIKNNQIGKRVQKPQPAEATVSRGKMVTLAENNLIKRKAQCQKPEVVKKELGEKSQEERVKGTLSKQSVRTQSLMPPRNAHSSLSNRNKVINLKSLQSESSQVKFEETLHEELVKVASLKQPHKTQSLLMSRNAHSSSSHGNKVITENAHSHDLVKVPSSKQPHKTQIVMALRNTNCSSSHGNKVFTENVHSQVEKPATAQGATGSAIVSRDGHNQIDNRMQKTQRIEAGLNLRNMAGGILMTESSQCRKAEINKEKSHGKGANVSSSLTSLIEARNASTLTQVKNSLLERKHFHNGKNLQQLRDCLHQQSDAQMGQRLNQNWLIASWRDL